MSGAFIEVKIDDMELLETGDIDQNLKQSKKSCW